MDISVPTNLLPVDKHPATLSLAQIARTLRRHALVIAAFAVVAAVGGYMYSRSLPRSYTAYSSIALDGERIAIPELQGVLRSDNMPDPLPLVRTEVQALSARQLIQGVIDKLHLANDPEFNAALRPPTLVDWVKQTIGSMMPHGPSNPAPPGPDETVLNAVTRALSIFQDNRSLVIAIAFTSQKPQLAAQFVNTLVTDYVSQRSSRRTQANVGADKELVDRIAQARSDLDGLEGQMKALRTRSDIVALRAGSVGQQQVEELATAAAAASVQRTTLEANWNRAVALGKNGSPDAMAGVLDSPTVSRLRDQESQISAKLAELTSHYGPAYPAVRSATADLAAVHTQLSNETARIVASIGSQLSAARDKETNLRQQLSAASHAGVAAENARAELDQLGKEAETRRILYQTLLQSEQRTAAQPAGSQMPDIRVLSAAVAPGFPSGPNTKLMVGMSGLGGLVLGCGLAMLRLRAVNGFDGAPDVTAATGLGVLAVLDRQLAHRGMAGRVLALPNGPEAKVLRSLRERIRYASHRGSPRTVLFTPTVQRPRTQELALAFARTAAMAGEHVLMIEADLEVPSAAHLLGIRSNGLSAALVRGEDWRNATTVDPLSLLDVLVCDQPIPGGPALLTGVAMQNLLIEARSDYQLVVLAGAAASSVQTAAMAARADLTVLILDGKSGSPAAQEARLALSNQPDGILAAVLVS